jgi:hypothetical protein
MRKHNDFGMSEILVALSMMDGIDHIDFLSEFFPPSPDKLL